MSDDPSTTPTEIKQAGPDKLAIHWKDGHQSLYPVRQLRLACACAECVDEWSGASRLESSTVPDDVAPTSIRSVGRYAIQIDWSDGHSTGIYSFEQLRKLSPADPSPE